MTITGAVVDGSFVPRARKDVASVTLDGETVIHRQGRVHLLDPVATLVWKSCDGEATLDQIAAELAESFGTAPDTVRRDVGAAVDQLDALGLLAESAATDDEDGPALLMDPPGSCASCAETPWTFRSSYLVGDRVVTVGTNSPRADAAMRAALAAHLVPTPRLARIEPPFFGVEVHDDQPDGGPQLLHVLHRGDTIAARSRRPGRILRALVAQLASYSELEPLGLAAVNGVVVGREAKAMIVEPPADLVRFGHALGRVGLQIADVPVALVRLADGVVVVGAPGLDVDLEPISVLVDDEPSREREPEPLAWGEYRLAGIGVVAPASAAAALLALGPETGDHRDHARTLAALVALVDTVAVSDAVEPEAIASHLV